jgi:hypothetical protein
MVGTAPLAPTDWSTVVTVVHATGCHFCADADTALAHLAQTYPLTVDRVDVRTPAGQELIRIHRPPMYPLVLVDGAFFSAGRLPRKKLARMLDRKLDRQPDGRPATAESGGLGHG